MPSRDNRDSQKINAESQSSPEPLVDRQLELDVLRQHIARVAETRKGHVVLILGESGVGKSRLAAEAGTPVTREPSPATTPGSASFRPPSASQCL
jgi:DNA-binding NtrC family response regulator